jgi:hypothetical protein
MTDLHFNEEDKAKFIEFLNTIAKTATFNLKTEEVISYFKLLSHMQQKILPKLDANILEVKRIVETKPEAEEVKPKGKK